MILRNLQKWRRSRPKIDSKKPNRTTNGTWYKENRKWNRRPEGRHYHQNKV